MSNASTDISQLFAEQEVVSENNIIGYINPDEVNPANYPPQAVTGCKNVRFAPDGTYIRPAYRKVADISALYPNYRIINVCDKVYIDKNGEANTVMIITLKSLTTGRVRIITDKFYSPTQNYRNNYRAGGGPFGWVNEMVDLTERYSCNPNKAVEGEIMTEWVMHAPPFNLMYNFSARNNNFAGKPLNYYKGWYFVDSSGNIRGLVNGSALLMGGNRCYFNVLLSDTYHYDPTKGFGIVRFPVTERCLDNLFAIDEVTYETKSGNMTRMYFGDKCPVLNLLFLKDYRYFVKLQTGGGIFQGTNSGWVTKLSDYKGNAVITFIEIKCLDIFVADTIIVVKFGWRNSSQSHYIEFDVIWWKNGQIIQEVHTVNDLTVRFNPQVNPLNIKRGDKVIFNIYKVPTSTEYDGFYFDKDAIDIPNKKILRPYDIVRNEEAPIGYEEIGDELGISYNVKSYKVISTTSEESRIRVYSLAIQVDGRQVFFVKNLYTGLYADSNHQYHGGLTIDIIFERWFNPRITASLLFLHTDYITQYSGVNDMEVPVGRLLEGDAKGHKSISELVVRDHSSYRFIGNVITNRVGTYPENYATGIKLHDYLNNYYWKSVGISAKGGVACGSNIVAYNPDNKAITRDLNVDSDKLSEFSIIVSQVQRGDQNTKSVMCSERYRQVSVGKPIVAVTSAIGNQFLVFTENDTYWYEIVDEVKLQLRNIAVYYDDGIINNKSVVSAVSPEEVQSGPVTSPYTSKFRGIFAAGNNGFYLYANNKRYNLLDIYDENERRVMSRWGEKYRNMPYDVKKTSMVSYNHNNGEVYWYLGGVIYVWNAIYGYWTIYEYPDAIEGFYKGYDGEIRFWNNLKIYRTNPVTEHIQKDKDTLPIGWEFSKLYGFGTEFMNKVVHGLELNYEAETVTRNSEVYIKLKCGNERGDNILYDNKRLIRNGDDKQEHIRQGYDLATRSAYHTIKIASDNNTINNLTKLKIKQIKVSASTVEGIIARR